MYQQGTIDFVSRPQNSPSNQAILEAKKPVLNYQCRVLLAAFKRGLRLTVADGIKGVWDLEEQRTVFIGDLRARVRDLISKGIYVKSEKTVGNYKVYFL